MARTATGTALTGLTGGLVSSTAVTLSFAREVRDNAQNTAALACGILLAWSVMFLRVIVLVAVLNRALLAPVLVPFMAMALAAGGYAGFLYFRDGSVDGSPPKGEVDIKNPFSLVEAAKFGALFAVVLLAVKIVQQHFPPSGLYASRRSRRTDRCRRAFTSMSMAELARSGEAGSRRPSSIVLSLLSLRIAVGEDARSPSAWAELHWARSS